MEIFLYKNQIWISDQNCVMKSIQNNVNIENLFKNYGNWPLNFESTTTSYKFIVFICCLFPIFVCFYFKIINLLNLEMSKNKEKRQELHEEMNENADSENLGNLHELNLDNDKQTMQELNLEINEDDLQ